MVILSSPGQWLGGGGMATSPTPDTEDHTELARTVAELQQLRYQTIPNSHVPRSEWDAAFKDMGGPLIDATFVYRTWVDKVGEQRTVTMDEFPSVKPPWSKSFVGYMNGKGVPYINYVWAIEPTEETGPPLHNDGTPMESCAWVFHIYTFAGLWGTPLKVVGPLFVTRTYVADDGGILHVSSWPLARGYDNVVAADIEKWPTITVHATFSLLNSTNCSIAESPLPRPLRRTEQRYGVRSHVIQVTTKNRSARSSRAGEPSSITYPLTSVRGHHAHYGDCCPRYHEPKGLLFGKLTGRVWVPQYARGDESVGRVEQTFVTCE